MKRMLILTSILLFLFLSCEGLNSGNNDPNPLVSPTNISISDGDATQTVRLVCSDNPDSAYLYDEDGDTVTVVADSSPSYALPDFITLNEDTGVLTIVRSTGGTGTLRFWTVDDRGGTTEGQALTISYVVSSTSNSAPSASFVGSDLILSGTGTVVDGNYDDTGATSIGKDVYSDGTYSIFQCLDPDIGYCWAIDNNPPSFTSSTGCETSDVTYYILNTDDVPPVSGWLTGSDTLSSLSVKTVPFSIIGDTITASYFYSDPDLDSEGNSKFKWYRNSIGAPDVYTEIVGETEITHDLSDDNGLRLKFEVTPVDIYNLEGTPELSGASEVIGST